MKARIHDLPLSKRTSYMQSKHHRDNSQMMDEIIDGIFT